MVTVYRYMINNYNWLCVYCYATQIYWYIIFNICPPLLFTSTHPSKCSATTTVNPPNTKKSVNTPFTCDVWKTTVLGVESHANTTLGFTLCCICHSTPPLVLYFLYVTHNGALACTYNSYSSNQ